MVTTHPFFVVCQMQVSYKGVVFLGVLGLKVGICSHVRYRVVM